MSYDTDTEEVKEEFNPEEEKRALDLFERCFGKSPEKGYEFRHVDVGVYWRAIVIRWSASGIGFGEMALVIEDKKIKIDTEGMGRDFCDALIAEAIKKIKEEESKLPPLTEEEQKWGRDPSIMLKSDFLQTMYNNVDWETEINPYVTKEDEEEEREDV